MYRVFVGGSATILILLGLLIAGWAPMLLASVWSSPIPLTDLSNPSMALTWVGFATARVFGATLLGIGLAFSGAVGLEGSEARRFALHSLGVVTGVPLVMAFLQAWAVVPRIEAWTLVALLFVIAAGSIGVAMALPSQRALSES